MDAYFEEKKRLGYVFTLHNINPSEPFVSMDSKKGYTQPVVDPTEVSYWSHLSGRYRTYEEQNLYVSSGCIDKELPPLKTDENGPDEINKKGVIYERRQKKNIEKDFDAA